MPSVPLQWLFETGVEAQQLDQDLQDEIVPKNILMSRTNEVNEQNRNYVVLA